MREENEERRSEKEGRIGQRKEPKKRVREKERRKEE